MFAVFGTRGTPILTCMAYARVRNFEILCVASRRSQALYGQKHFPIFKDFGRSTGNKELMQLCLLVEVIVAEKASECRKKMFNKRC